MSHAARCSEGSQGSGDDAGDDLQNGFPGFLFHFSFLLFYLFTFPFLFPCEAGTRPAVRLRLRLFLLRIRLQLVDAHELSLLQELAARDVHLLLLLRQESDVQGLDVLLHRELVLRQRSQTVLDGGVERAQAVNLHLLRVEQHFQQTAAELLKHAEYDVLRVDTAMFRDVLRHLSRVQRFHTLDASVPLAVGSRLRVLVLRHFINNLCHSCVCFFVVLDSFAASCTGWPTSR